MESYKEPGPPPKKRYVLVDVDALLSKSPSPDSQDTVIQDTGNPDTVFQDLNQYLLNPALNEVTPEYDPHSPPF